MRKKLSVNRNDIVDFVFSFDAQTRCAVQTVIGVEAFSALIVDIGNLESADDIEICRIIAENGNGFGLST